MADRPWRRRLVRAAVGALILAGCAVGTAIVHARCWNAVLCETVSGTASPGLLMISRDERTISIAGPEPCYGSVSLSATEHPDRVIVAELWTRPAHPPVCTAQTAMGSWSTRLKAPVGTRTLIDAATGQPATWIGGASLLDPGYLPPGFVLDRLSTFSPFLIDRSTDAPCYERLYVAGQMPHYTQLTISECRGTFAAAKSTIPQVTIQGNVAVAGTTGQIRFENVFGGTHAVIWTRNNWTYTVASTGEDGPLPDETLLAVANGLA
jgi:hypothetical protein